jgi:two-component system, NtrC family, nitrogen regulation response regulator GlnG
MTRMLHPLAPILLVDDEEQALQSYAMNLRYAGLTNTIRCPDPLRAPHILADHPVSLALVDLNMPDLGGEDLLELLRRDHPAVPVIVITGYNEVETAVRCMRAGALDYLVKPVDRSRLVSAVQQALERAATPAAAPAAGPAAGACAAFPHLVTTSPTMLSVLAYVESVAATPEPVLIIGETGVGKEMAAQAVHRAGGRSGRFVACNAAGLDDPMFADTLFGHAKGAFTGAASARAGLIEEAAGGTLFLDEIGDLSQASQLKLLRLIQEREYYPLGSDQRKVMDAKLVAATNKPLEELMQEGAFRLDLFFRLRTHTVRIPPLRDRPEDLALLAEHFLAKGAERLRRRQPALPSGLLDLLAGYRFPGNVRELEAMIFNALAQSGGSALTLEPFRAWMGAVGSGDVSPPTLRELRESAIQEALDRVGGNQSAAARLLGVSRQAINRRLLRQRQAGGRTPSP